MYRRPLLSLPWQTMLAAGVGLGLNAVLKAVPDHPLIWIFRGVAAIAGSLFLTWTRALAVPLVISSLVLGAVGLEPMRALGKIAGRTLLWMAVSSLLAVLVGAGAAFVLPPARGDWGAYAAVYGQVNAPGLGSYHPAPWGWAALVLPGLGFAYYRNQIDEGYGRLLLRFCHGLEQMLKPMLEWTLRLAPWGVVALLLGAPSLPTLKGDTLEHGGALLSSLLGCLVVGWVFYTGVALPVLLWTQTKINPWKYFIKLFPAALTAFASGALEPVLPLTFQTIRGQVHASNRVAGVVLSLCAVFQREGWALGLVTITFCRWRLGHSELGWQFPVIVLLAGWLLAIGAQLTQFPGIGLIVLLVSGFGLPSEGVFVVWVLERFITMGGAAVGVLSSACAVAIIARGEGEFWVPGPPPDPDELQGLKTELELAED